MARSYYPVHDTLAVERMDDQFTADVRFIVNEPGEPPRHSAVLDTFALGRLGAHLALIYFRRTGKLLLPLDQCVAGAFKTACIEGEKTVAEWKASPAQANARKAEGPDTSACSLCLDECTGDCI